MKKFMYFCLIFVPSCANVLAPTGGDKDLDPPRLIETEPAGSSNNFKNNTISMVFDEQIQFSKKQKMYISPHLKDKPELSINKNKLKIKLNSALKENTTYEIILDEVIKDLNEGNIINNLYYRFSTGQNIDSLKISGRTINAANKRPLQNVWVCLYNKDNDSLLYKHTPNYITKSDASGFYSFLCLPDSSYTIFAIEDMDNNLRFTIPNEKVGFINSLVKSNSTGVDIYLFDETTIADSVTHHTLDSTITSFGKLIIDSLPDKKNLIIELLSKEKIIYRNPATYPTIIDSLRAGNYNLRIIEDTNNNGVWDSGNLLEKKQPEWVAPYPKEIKIREDWSVVIEWVN